MINKNTIKILLKEILDEKGYYFINEMKGVNMFCLHKAIQLMLENELNNRVNCIIKLNSNIFKPLVDEVIVEANEEKYSFTDEICESINNIIKVASESPYISRL